ncbi:hypothetical protein [Macrococcoides caseolyticum]|uniref:Uncharacterized protein n=1 Tax=Macrococcus caseolyticus (strain JCSC5402) TaxID=458233 RepID=B9EBL5_MACCJ|nr:hypothetical protein [Macrococcus caseolyticus]BAH17626.1 hypothetical protein MCCL_0919 [Macrococcus caseolyticus JCSC5402]
MEEYYYYVVEIVMSNGAEYSIAVGFSKERPEWECQKLFSDWISNRQFVSVHSGNFDDFNISVRHILSYRFKVERYDYDELGISAYNLE